MPEMMGKRERGKTFSTSPSAHGELQRATLGIQNHLVNNKGFRTSPADSKKQNKNFFPFSLSPIAEQTKAWYCLHCGH